MTETGFIILEQHLTHITTPLELLILKRIQIPSWHDLNTRDHGADLALARP